MNNFKELIELSKQKNLIDKKRAEDKYFDYKWLLNEIVNEIEEVSNEIKDNNKPYLEDELGDILWGWIILVEKLRDKNLCGDFEDIIDRSLKKYQERILPLKGDKNDYTIWNEVKKIQKEELERELNSQS